MSGIIRVKKDQRYFVASNEPFNDEKLSWGARGIMGYLLSKPDGWQVRNQDLYNQSPAGRRAVDRMLGELQEQGYMNRYRVRDEHGHLYWQTDIYESKSLNPEYKPEQNECTERAKPHSGPNVHLPTVGKPHDIVSTELVSTYVTTTTEKPSIIFEMYRKNVNPMPSQIEIDCLTDIEETYPEEWITYAITTAVKARRASVNYIEGILKRVKAQNGTLEYVPNKTTHKQNGKQNVQPAGNDTSEQTNGAGSVASQLSAAFRARARTSSPAI